MNFTQNKLLTRMKLLVYQHKRRFQIRKDRNYKDELAKIGITVNDAWNHILSLNSNFYYPDTKMSYRQSKDTLIFKKTINNILVYIKLKIEKKENDEEVVCLSFHKDGEKYEM